MIVQPPPSNGEGTPVESSNQPILSNVFIPPNAGNIKPAGVVDGAKPTTPFTNTATLPQVPIAPAIVLPAAPAVKPIGLADPAIAGGDERDGYDGDPKKWWWWASELPMMLWVLAGGAIGAIAATTIEKGFIVKGAPLGFAGAALLGGIAAGLGVYVLAATDTRRFGRTVFFAVACGLCGQTVIDKTVTSVNDTLGINNNVLNAKSAEAKLTNAVRTDSAAGIASAISDASVDAVGLVTKSAAATRQSDSAGAKKADAAVVSLVEKVAAAGPKTVDASSAFFETVGLQAVKDNNETVKAAVDSSILKILSSPDIADKPEFQKRLLDAAAVLKIQPASGGVFAPGQSGRVYLEIAPKTQTRDLALWRGFLAATGFSVKSLGYVSDLNETECRVLYYDPADEPTAAQLVTMLKGNITNPTVQGKIEAAYIKGVAGVSPGHFDVRLGPEALKSLYSVPTVPQKPKGTQ